MLAHEPPDLEVDAVEVNVEIASPDSEYGS